MLKESLQALAQPAHVQAALFPAFVVVPDELALNFDAAYAAALSNTGISARSLQLLNLLNQQLETMSAPGNERVWNGIGALEEPEWSKVRSLALEALGSLGWPASAPQIAGREYVQSSRP